MSLGDYNVSLPSNVLDAHNDNLRTPRGPLISPIKAPACDAPPKSAEEALKKIAQNTGCEKSILETLLLLVSNAQDLLTANFIPKGALPLNQGSSAPTSLPAAGSGGGTWTTVLTVQLDEGYEAMIQKVGTIVYPETAFTDVTWRLRLNNAPMSKFDNQSFPVQNIATPFALPVSVRPGVTITLQALNSATIANLVSGYLGGWTQSVKRY